MQTVKLCLTCETCFAVLLHCLCHINIIWDMPVLLWFRAPPSLVTRKPSQKGATRFPIHSGAMLVLGRVPCGNSWRVSCANLRWSTISIVWTCDLLHYMRIWVPYCLINIILPIMCIFEPLSLRPLIA